MGNTAEITASPKLRARFAVAASIMLALCGWSLVQPIENWGILTKTDFLTSPSSSRRSPAYPLEFTCLLARLPDTEDMLAALASRFLSLPE